MSNPEAREPQSQILDLLCGEYDRATIWPILKKLVVGQDPNHTLFDQESESLWAYVRKTNQVLDVATAIVVHADTVHMGDQTYWIDSGTFNVVVDLDNVAIRRSTLEEDRAVTLGTMYSI